MCETVMNLARALKEKNRIAGKLAETRNKIRQENSWQESRAPRTFDIEKLYATAETLESNLVKVKTAIAKANAGTKENPDGIIEKIIRLEEIRGKISFLDGIDTTAGIFDENAYGNKITRTLTAVITSAKKAELREALQAEANQLQDEIDDYNASTLVRVVLL